MENEQDILGTEIDVSISLDRKNGKTYEDNVADLMIKIGDAIEETGNKFVFADVFPLFQKDMDEWTAKRKEASDG